MDEETKKNWPIPDDFALDFDALKHDNMVAARLLPLYHEGYLVEPAHANQIMNGAIVEVQFSIQHWRIKNFDSFQATAEKMTVLRLGPIHVPSHYKHANPDEEPDGQLETKKAQKQVHLKGKEGPKRSCICVRAIKGPYYLRLISVSVNVLNDYLLNN
ncbi:hypothetical protein F4604DRAFT_1801170 [Suillus subluteus]|nr:hypothetical protein F4604DRAFT_1801170 [Suillus subluteus]